MKKTANHITFGISFFLFIAFFIQACESPSRVSNRNLSGLYSKKNFEPKVEVRFFHENGDSSNVYFSISRSDLLYVKQQKGDSESLIQLSWKLFTGYDSRHLLDSASFIITDKNNFDLNENIYGRFRIKIPIGPLVVCELKITDLNRQSENSYIIETVKDSTFRSRDCFRIELNNEFLIQNYISTKDTFSIKKTGETKNLLVRYYNREFPLPTPPFSTERIKPFEYFADSIFILDSEKDNSLIFSQQGFYHFQADSTDKAGYTLFRFSDDFPAMTDALSLLYPIRYLSTRKEHENILMAKDKKAALDNYWIMLGGSQERARELIKQFYSRVQDSNKFFTCHTEGWRTDRGLIYIVFGRPNSVYRNSLSETWIYGSGGNSLSTSFNFEKVKNPFSNNDYMLQRSPSYEMPWYTAVESWRQGRAFNQK